MWAAAFNSERQLLELSFSQHVDRAQAKACALQVTALLNGAAPGFCLLNDLTGLQVMEFSCGPVIDQMMDLLSQRGVEKIVRIVPDPSKDIGFGIMSMFHYDRDVRVITCETMEQAQSHLPMGKRA